MINQTTNQTIVEPLLKYISQTEEQSISIKIELEATVTSPLDYIQSGVLSEDNPIYDEAYLVSDAIEAVSNGMMNDSILQDLKLIKKDSLLYSWRLLAEAIDLFYKNDQENLKKTIIKIPDHTTTARLKPLLLHRLLNNELPAKQQIFIDEIVLDNSYILETVEQLEEAIILDLPDLFNQMSFFLIKELQSISEKHANLAKKWVLNHSNIKNIKLDSMLEEKCLTASDTAEEAVLKSKPCKQLSLFDFVPETEPTKIQEKYNGLNIKQICADLPIRYKYLGPGFWFRFLRKSLTLKK